MKSFKNGLLLTVFVVSPFMFAGTQKKPQTKTVSTNLKMEYVDSYAVIRESKEGQEFAKEMESKRIDLGKELKELEQKFTMSAKGFQTKASTMSEVGRAREQKDLAKMEREYKGKLQESEEDMKISMQMGQERLFREHNQAVFDYAKSNSIDLVFGPGGVIYASEKANCTFDIVDGMNKNYEIKLAKAREPKNKTTAVAKGNSKDKKKATA